MSYIVAVTNSVTGKEQYACSYSYQSYSGFRDKFLLLDNKNEAEIFINKNEAEDVAEYFRGNQTVKVIKQ